MITEKDFMLCESINEEEALKLDDNNTSNIKFDGNRLIAVVINHDAILVNRHGRICNFNFREVAEDLKPLNDCIIDGEIISLEDDFTKLQRRAGTKNTAKLIQLEKEIPIKFMVFDVLRQDNTITTNKPLRERIEILKQIFEGKALKHTELAEYKPIKEMLEIAKKQDREGIIVKDLNAVYENKRSNGWKKLKFFLEDTMKAIKYEVNPKGITVEDDKGNRVAVLGEQSTAIRQQIDTTGEVEIYVQFLEKTPDNRYRFPSYRGVVNNTTV
jgi:ATP-dependent DNA ligase